MGNFISNLGNKIANTFADTTPIGRMVTKGENVFEANINSIKERTEIIGDALANNTDALANNTPIGRMVTKGENFFEAQVNAFKENLGLND